ncbi:MAG: AAA domain-containing protein [Lentisphaerae bacterium]|nr:AAA domain-containing protein [Lentisphaerota bacterium]
MIAVTFATLFSPMELYLVGIAFLTVLTILFVFSIVYYWKAKDLAPKLLRLQDVQRKIVTEEVRLEELKAELAAKSTELAKAERVIAEGKNEQAWLEANRAKAEALKVEVASLHARVDEELGKVTRRHEELEALQKQKVKTEEESKAAKIKKETMDIEVASLQEKRNTLDREIEERSGLKAETDALKNERNDLELSVKELHRKFGDADKALREKEADLAAAHVLLGQADAARQVLAQLDKTRDMNEERWKDLDRPLVAGVTTPKQSSLDEKTWLVTFEKRLAENGFIFNPRAIRAFHTGLKCSETSPLVVLAGISGTGKSLLPELYAAALGMNFLPVAVQPRWDSPQDLFGFYNYMEGRYKATELSRLLWQFDKYNNEKAKALFAKQTPVSLVLLDEMNLARVEYYFSDLLSKLEIRTGLNADNAVDRRKAEIELECNAMAKADQSRRLFVGLNTLFIGTMNEDESTQTLSEKVLDRANVIRFGRPSQLAVLPQKDIFLHAFTNSPTAITFDNWHAWCSKSLTPADKNNLKQTVTELNDAMSAVGRPFGHRVNLAIERYVAVYPGAFNEALSDQIEMKILPKLNGLDSQEDGFHQVMKKLGGVIAGLRDDALMNAFEASCDHASASFFKWRGVMR